MTETLTAPVAEEATESKRKPVLLAGGLAAVLALAGGGYLLLSGGGSSSDAGSFTVRPAVHRALPAKPLAKTAAKAPTAAKPAALLPAATTVALGRDPFIPLYVQPAAPAAGAGTTAAAPTATTAPATSTTSTSTTTGSTATGTSGTGTVATTAYALQLVSITKVTGSGRTYTFTYGGVTKKVLEGQRFGKYGEITVLGVTTKAPNDTATGAIIQVGDDEPFTVMIGEKVSVK